MLSIALRFGRVVLVDPVSPSEGVTTVGRGSPLGRICGQQPESFVDSFNTWVVSVLLKGHVVGARFPKLYLVSRCQRQICHFRGSI
jgi:hypothetical protein